MCPLYEYVCPECKEGFECFNTMADRELGYCPNCGLKGKKLLSVFNLTHRWTLMHNVERFTPDLPQRDI